MKSGIRVIGIVVISLLINSGLTSCSLSFKASADTSINSSATSSYISTTSSSGNKSSSAESSSSGNISSNSSSSSSATSSSSTTSSSQTTSSTSSSTSSNNSSTSTNTSSSSQSSLTSDPYTNVNTTTFYSSYTKASSYADATYRSQHNLMSGDITVPQLKPTICSAQPTESGKIARNYSNYYTENNMAYNVVDYLGNKVNTIYYGGAYITLEEVAAYLYAFGDVPANYIASNKTSSLSSSSWGKYLRLNHNFFSDDTSKFVYEPELPDAYTGSNTTVGTKKYYEIDIGTTGYNDSTYMTATYNTGSKITRGIARIVYTRYWAGSGTELSSSTDRYVFYTQNHYNDFREYLNYQNGWGTIFGNETGGGTRDNSTSIYKTSYPSTGTINL